MVMFCRGDLSEQAVYDLTKTFWENIDQLGEAQANLKGLTPEEAVKLFYPNFSRFFDFSAPLRPCHAPCMGSES